MNSPPSISARDWWTRPSVVLPLLATLALLVALVTPQAVSGRFGDPRLSSHFAGSMGARVLADMAHRMGWRIVRQDSQPAPTGPTGRTIHAVLAPTIPLTAADAHAYLDAVRRGDALLLVLDARTALSDSLGVTHLQRGGFLAPNAMSSRTCAKRVDFTPSLWPDGRVHLWGIRWLRPAPDEQVIFASLELDPQQGTVAPGNAAVGFPYGQGRVIVVGDPDLLRNDVVRRCAWGTDVLAVRMLEWLRGGGPAPRTTLAFDEYHQGFGSRPTVFSVTGAFLIDHPVGRTLLQVVLAALTLLLAVAPRAIKPKEVERIERRDPLEQVDALAHAYEQVHATRTISARLLQGLRWRLERGGTGTRARPDDAFLTAALTRAPALKEDVTLVRRALLEPVNDRELPEIGAALHRIEHTLTTIPT
jgi:hypothetical protein